MKKLKNQLNISYKQNTRLIEYNMIECPNVNTKAASIQQKAMKLISDGVMKIYF